MPPDLPHNPLDNAVWHALTGPQAGVAERLGEAVRFPTDVSPFGALPDAPGAGAWDDLAALLGPSGTGALFRADDLALPAGWTELERFDGLQMVQRHPAAATSPPTTTATVGSCTIERLGTGDVDDMLELVARTAPGPFERRTVGLGTYLGVRDGGRLVAMAGERMQLPGHTEISAVCTDVTHQGQGLAAALVGAVVQGIAARGERAFLHVLTSNASAIRIYERLGFEGRTRTTAVVLQPPPAR